MEQQHTLTQWGINLSEVNTLNHLSAEDRYNFLKSQFGTYEQHVVRNNPVSSLYHYWFSNEKIYTNPERTQELELDPKERDGLYEQGIKESFRLAQTHPNQLVFLYSPPGPASFKDPPDPEYAKPYNIGQLYIMYHDGKKINNLGVSINGQGENWLRELYDPTFLMSLSEQNIIDQIKKFITTPQLTGWTVDDFLDHNWQDPEMTIFKSDNLGKEEKHYLSGIMHGIRDSLLGQIKQSSYTDALAWKLAYEGDRFLSEDRLMAGYQAIITNVMQQNGITEMKLGGGCGGASVRSSDLTSKMSIDSLLSKPNLSSDARKFIQSSNPFNKKGDTEEIHYTEGICTQCNTHTQERGVCSKMCKGCEKVHFWPKVKDN